MPLWSSFIKLQFAIKEHFDEKEVYSALCIITKTCKPFDNEKIMRQKTKCQVREIIENAVSSLVPCVPFRELILATCDIIAFKQGRHSTEMLNHINFSGCQSYSEL